MNRRHFLLAATVSAPLLAAKSQLRVGVTDWNLRLASKIEAVALASSLGFEGVEVSLGRKPEGDALPLANADLQKQYLDAAAKEKIALAGTCLDILHVNYLKNDKLGQRWVADGIEITRKLGARVMLLPFFGKGALETQAERDYVGDVLRELAPTAEKARVVLGLENTCSAKDNVAIMERTRSTAVLVYYDVGNSTNNGHNVLEEIPWLGAARICQFHLKDGRSYLGEGKIGFSEVINSIMNLGFKGFANLETSSPSGNVGEDMKRNLTFVREMVKKHA